MATTTTTHAAATAATAAAAAAARDSLKTAELHHRFAQDIQRQIEAEYNAAVDEEIAACSDMELKRRHAEEMEESHMRALSGAFRSLVKATGGQTCVACSISRAAAESAQTMRLRRWRRAKFLSHPPARLPRHRAAVSE